MNQLFLVQTIYSRKFCFIVFSWLRWSQWNLCFSSTVNKEVASNEILHAKFFKSDLTKSFSFVLKGFYNSDSLDSSLNLILFHITTTILHVCIHLQSAQVSHPRFSYLSISVVNYWLFLLFKWHQEEKNWWPSKPPSMRIRNSFSN